MVKIGLSSGHVGARVFLFHCHGTIEWPQLRDVACMCLRKAASSGQRRCKAVAHFSSRNESFSSFARCIELDRAKQADALGVPRITFKASSLPPPLHQPPSLPPCLPLLPPSLRVGHNLATHKSNGVAVLTRDLVYSLEVRAVQVREGCVMLNQSTVCEKGVMMMTMMMIRG